MNYPMVFRDDVAYSREAFLVCRTFDVHTELSACPLDEEKIITKPFC